MGPNLVFCYSFAARTPLTAGVTDRQTGRQTDRQTDRQTGRHNQGALGLLVLNKTKLGIITYLISGTKFPNLGGYRILFDQGVLCIMKHERIVRT